jgi:PTS system mannose-specific IIC component
MLNNVPQVITDIISVLGGVLPALGIALLMSIIVKEKIQLIFFFAGFVLLAFAKLSMISLVFLAALVAYIVYLSIGKPQAATTANTNVSDDFVEDDDLF